MMNKKSIEEGRGMLNTVTESIEGWSRDAEQKKVYRIEQGRSMGFEQSIEE